ncbi:3,4-dihydroxy-2-butanone-4-phosphate synthase [Lentisphaera marina]|uniref:3,4-dihydroxy-2-butanone-4-phosphate synthase n=1 Tax=Lentisphaera marina TaxID=1111041 RepID=UPI00236536F5|nr:3,4-dihydroxy-2-butanone-4-phosphate synthase [Lentisphaera marina]MDD7984870.1 3,4-dihydroxy-2-butanone-4-phosphate synthase [Lentisphaera marina]
MHLILDRINRFMQELKDIDKALQEIKAGQCVIVADEANYFLMFAAPACTSAYVTFMMNECRGQVQIALKKSSPLNSTLNRQTFELNSSLKTGINANDRCHGILRMLDENVVAEDFVSPGFFKVNWISHGAVLVKPGIAEAAYDLARLADYPEGAVFCQLLDDQANSLSKTQVKDFAKNNDMAITDLNDIIEYRLIKEPLVEALNIVNMPTDYGDFRLHVYNVIYDPARGIDLVLTCGKDKFEEDETVLVRVHSEWSIGNIVNRLKNEEGSSLNRAMKQVADEGCGVIVFLRNTPEQAANSGLFTKSKRPTDIWIEDGEVKTLKPQDGMAYGLGAQILRDLGVRKMKLMSNSPASFTGINNYGLEIVEQVNY